MSQIPDPRARLIQHYLSEAQKNLDLNNLEETQKHFDEALGVAGEHPNRASDIQQVLKRYCDKAVDLPAPDWETIRQALDLFDILKIQNDETRSYQQEVKLKEARFLLVKQDKLDESFMIFANLMAHAERQGGSNKLKTSIAQIVYEYASLRADEQEWPLLRQVFERAQQLWPATDSLQDWLETISKILEVASQIQIRHKQELTVLEETKAEQFKQIERLNVELSTVRKNQEELEIEIVNLTQACDRLQSDSRLARQRAQMLTYALIFILVLAVLMYPIALFLP